MMCGYLLARAGIRVAVLEKHKDFLRDFRGDTVHPSTMEAMWELGLLEDFLKLPHYEIRELVGQVGETAIRLGDFTHVTTHAKFIALMPQCYFLNFLCERGKRFPEFQVLMRAEATSLIEAEGGRIEGVRVETPDGPLEVRADLVIGADGRTSIVRAQAGLEGEDFGAPMDVLWMRLPRQESDAEQAPLGRIDAGLIFVMLPRGDYYQCGYVAAKGSIEAIKARGLEAFKADIARLSPLLAARVDALKSWDDVKLLTVSVDRLKRWSREGLICIGDSAHAMSPVGGVGINLAIQDAIAAANLLFEPLGRGSPSMAELDAVRRRRMPAVKLIQAIQLTIQKRVIAPTLASTRTPTPPWVFKLFNVFPILRRIPAQLLGVGYRMEHVRTPYVHI